MKNRVKLTSLILLTSLTLTPATAFSTRLSDKNYSHERYSQIESSIPLELKSKLKLRKEKGFTANYFNENQLVQLIKILYGNDVEKTDEDGVAYLLFGKWETAQDGKEKTLFDTIGLNDVSTIYM